MPEMELMPSKYVFYRLLRRARLAPQSIVVIMTLVVFGGLGATRAQDSPTNIVIQFAGGTSGTASERRLTIWVGLDIRFPTQGVWPTGTVEYATVDGTARGGRDYVPVQGTYHYYPNQSPLQPYIVVHLMEDTEAEPDEYFLLTLRNPQNGAALGSKTNLMIIILDNDSLAGPGLGPDTGAFFRGFYRDNKTLVTGAFRAVDGVARAGIARLNPDNTLDQTFELSSEICAQPADGAVQGDGKVLLAGCLTNADNQQLTYQPMFRVTTEGMLDPTFNAYVLDRCCNAEGPIRQILPQPDGRIIISGLFTNVNGIGRPGIARLEQDGSVDLGFVVETLPRGGFSELTLLPDGKYLGVQLSQTVIRLNADGSHDPTFNLETNGYCSVQPRVMAVQPDGKVLVGGSYCVPATGGFETLVIRYNADGSVDRSFIATNHFTGGNGLTKMTLQPDGQVLVAGSFESVNGLARSCLARLNPNGSVDENFPTASAGVTFVGVRPDDKIFLCGWFTSVAGIPRYYVALLNPDGTLVCNAHPRSPVLLSSGDFQFSLQGYEEGAYTIDASTDLQHWTPIHTNTPGNVLLNFTDPIHGDPPLRLFRTRVWPP
jgi:uncharacterized delta-60 repeat protein